MKNLKDLFQAEFKNLYAMEKQITTDLESFPEVSNKKFSKALNQMSKSNAENFEKIQKLNSDMELNPGSTTDSVAQELLKNINDIDNQKLSAEMHEAGMLASFNRLSNYRTTNYYNAYRMAKVAKMKTEAKTIKKMLKRSQKESKKLMKSAKKSVFKQARD